MCCCLYINTDTLLWFFFFFTHNANPSRDAKRPLARQGNFLRKLEKKGGSGGEVVGMMALSLGCEAGGVRQVEGGQSEQFRLMDERLKLM